MKRKVLILDIDGTLTNSKKEITPETLAALLDIQKRGHTIVIASGRPTHGVKWIADTLQLEKYDGYILCFNGAKITRVKTGETVYQQIFPKECIAPLYEYAKGHDMGMVTYEGDSVIAATRIDEYMKLEAGINRMELKQTENFLSYVDFEVNKCLFTAGTEEAPQLEREMASAYEGRLSIYRSEPFFIEAMPLGVDKAASLERLFAIIGVDREDTVACGDGFNDISMIQYAGVGVAMANAQETVKKAADVVTKKTNDENGLLEIIDDYFR
ncbi:MAG: Cof-type HAD-IIB family hydrolase [Bacteroidales bacterium]|nr:Cof-type HAD-IIB family hydrolase [Clostridium sp.]MCM1203931.1 Cof-type HAD-IIB family hydrolase [Bacteroidales bacterium]